MELSFSTDVWNSISVQLLQELDEENISNFWEILLGKYYANTEPDANVAPGKKSRDLLILMRSLVECPIILHPEYTQENMFSTSAARFYDAYCGQFGSLHGGVKLIKYLLVDFHSLLNIQEVKTGLDGYVSFIESLAKCIRYKTRIPKQVFLRDVECMQTVVRSYEFYADICKASPRLAMQILECFPLWPDSKNFTAQNLVSSPLFTYFFWYLTVDAPKQLPNFQLQMELYKYPKNDLSEEEMRSLCRSQTELMRRVHQAQHVILSTFLKASFATRDYTLSFIATLTEANIPRWADIYFPRNDEGVMINLTRSLMETIRPTLTRPPTLQTAKQFFLYLFSDLGRIDFLQRDLPSEDNLRHHLYYLMNWLRPVNYLAQKLDSGEWWRILRSSVAELAELAMNGLECHPRASFSQFIKELTKPTDSLLFSPSILHTKSLFDYSLNYFITGLTPPTTLPSHFAHCPCNGCGKMIVSPPCYRCVNCKAYVLCPVCYEKEVEKVCQAYRHPFSQAVRELFWSEEDVSRNDHQHNPYTHFFTELLQATFVVSRRPVFVPTPSFIPQYPTAYQAIIDQTTSIHTDTVNSTSASTPTPSSNRPATHTPTHTPTPTPTMMETPEGRAQLVEQFKAISMKAVEETDEAYEFWDGNGEAAISKYSKSMCVCLTDRPCGCHGPVTQAFRRATQRLHDPVKDQGNEGGEGRREMGVGQARGSSGRRVSALTHGPLSSTPTPTTPTPTTPTPTMSVEDLAGHGFTLHYQCFTCKTSPIIGTMYYCQQCGLTLCRACYQQDMQRGKGVPSHQSNHVFALIYHPVDASNLIEHNRCDFRTIEMSTSVQPTALTTSGVVLDLFMPSEEYAHRNDGNLTTELFMLSLRMMMVQQVESFREVSFLQFFRERLDVAELRKIQLSAGNAVSLYLGLANHLAFNLLQLITLHIPESNKACTAGLELPYVIVPDIQKETSMNNNNNNNNPANLFRVKVAKRPKNVHSRLWDLVITSVEVAPLFSIIATRMLDLLCQTFAFCIRDRFVRDLRLMLESGELDYVLLLLCLSLSGKVITNKPLQTSIVETMYLMCTVSKTKEEMEFLFDYPIVRHSLLMFTQNMFINIMKEMSLSDILTLRMHVLKITILILRVKRVGMKLQ